jgi:folate-dependent phosphoribosylglycinamide formyltransferase PurN
MNKLLVIGNDKIGRRMYARLGANDCVQIVIDASSNPKRVLRLIRKRVIPISLLIKMVWAEIFRYDYPVEDVKKIYTNADLLSFINEQQIDRVYLFRGSLIINQKVINSRADIYNVHCASIPDYGGLGAIQRALEDNALDQEATLHRVTEKVDVGEVIRVMPYKLVKNYSYRQNEDIAYNAGIQLLVKELGG